MKKASGKGIQRKGICPVSVKRKVRMLASCVKDLFGGVDFTFPDRMYDRGRNDGAMYYATPENVLKKIFGFINPKRYPSFWM